MHYNARLYAKNPNIFCVGTSPPQFPTPSAPMASRFSRLRRLCSAPSGYTSGPPPMGRSKLGVALNQFVPSKFWR